MQYVALKQKGLKSILNPFGHFEKKTQKNNWHSIKFSTIGHNLTVLGHKRGNLAYFGYV